MGDISHLEKDLPAVVSSVIFRLDPSSTDGHASVTFTMRTTGPETQESRGIAARGASAGDPAAFKSLCLERAATSVPFRLR
jgi:hypothetical protein